MPAGIDHGEQMMRLVSERFGPWSGKALLIGALTIVLLWPLARVERLVEERQQLRVTAFESIASGWGGAQQIGAPLLSVPMQKRSWVPYETAEKRTERWLDSAPTRLVATSVEIQAALDVRHRTRGIYTMPVYTATVVMRGHFDRAALEALRESEQPERGRLERAQVHLPLSSLKSLRSLQSFQFDQQLLKGQGGDLAGMDAITADIDLDAILRSKESLASPDAAPSASAGGVPFRIELTLAGTDALQFLPLGSATTIDASGNWGSPEFHGAFLPDHHQVHKDRFEANWRVLQLNRALPSSWRGNEQGKDALTAAGFGFGIFEPVDVYARSYRAIRYGVLFVAITFLCFFAWEHGGTGVRLHPMNYLLVGLALAVFFLLLVALSEQIGFDWAYLAAASALVALLTIYVSGVVDRSGPAWVMGGAMSAAYGALYVILGSEDYALLLGAGLVFGVLAMLMIGTRRFDWTTLKMRSID
jgi:inner membrane protein